MQISGRQTRQDHDFRCVGRHRSGEFRQCARLCCTNCEKFVRRAWGDEFEQGRYIDSSGVASLVEGPEGIARHGSRVAISFGLSTSAREVLQLSRLLKIFEVYDNEEQALAG